MFALVNVARCSGVDAEEALAASNRKFRRRWARMEELARAQGRVTDANPEEKGPSEQGAHKQAQ